MKKLTLELGDLAVESFVADREPPVKGGTVEGREGAPTLLDLCTRMTGLCPCTPRADQL
jgi:hypothetical protein